PLQLREDGRVRGALHELHYGHVRGRPPPGGEAHLLPGVGVVAVDQHRGGRLHCSSTRQKEGTALSGTSGTDGADATPSHRLSTLVRTPLRQGAPSAPDGPSGQSRRGEHTERHPRE